MTPDAFRPVDLLRQIEDHYAVQAAAAGSTLEAFASLGCNALRRGPAAEILAMLLQLLGPDPFAGGGQVRAKFSARTGRPLVIELTLPGGHPLPDAAQLAPLHALGGSLVVEEEAELVLRLTLPLDEVIDEPVAAVAIPADEESRLDGLRVLIADDSPTNRLVLEEMLGDTGALITTVNDGQEAVTAWEAGEFDLLLLDISMPVMDGVTALRTIREREKALGRSPAAAIAVTANALVNQVVDYLVAGFDSHLAKPFRRSELLNAITTLRK